MKKFFTLIITGICLIACNNTSTNQPNDSLRNTAPDSMDMVPPPGIMDSVDNHMMDTVHKMVDTVSSSVKMKI